MAVILILAIIAIGLWYLQRTGSKIQQNNNTTGTGENAISGQSMLTNLYVGKDVILSGDLQATTDQLKYSYILRLGSNEKVGLISTKTSIGNYNGKVTVKGTVNSYENNMYIIDVSFITADTNTALSNTTDTKTYFADANLLVDISSNPMLTVSSTPGAITITDTNSKMTGDTITISYFTCQKNDPLKDCAQIKTSAQ